MPWCLLGLRLPANRIACHHLWRWGRDKGLVARCDGCRRCGVHREGEARMPDGAFGSHAFPVDGHCDACRFPLRTQVVPSRAAARHKDHLALPPFPEGRLELAFARASRCARPRRGRYRHLVCEGRFRDSCLDDVPSRFGRDARRLHASAFGEPAYLLFARSSRKRPACRRG